MGATSSSETPINREEASEEFRRLAAEEARQRDACFQQSQEAFREGRGADAKLLSNRGKEHAERMKAYNQRASDEIFAHHNKDRDLSECDLHGLYVKDALERAKKHIAKCKEAGVRKTVFIT